METQKCKLVFRNEMHELEEMFLNSVIVPENSMGIIFRIESQWHFQLIENGKTKLTIEGCE